MREFFFFKKGESVTCPMISVIQLSVYQNLKWLHLNLNPEENVYYNKALNWNHKNHTTRMCTSCGGPDVVIDWPELGLWSLMVLH